MSNTATGEAAPYTERRYWGKYRGTVVDVQDPHRLGRVKCRVLEILGMDITTDWATLSASLYGGSNDYGSFQVPEVGSTVFIEFESGDVNRPLVTGIWWGRPKGKPPETPALAREDGDNCWKTDESTKSPKGDDKFKSADCGDQCQPGSPLRVKGPPKYPFNQVTKTKNNKMIIEVDDTPGLGRFHLWHGPSKSWFELDKDGELSIRIADKSYVLVEKDARLHVKGSKHTLVETDMTHKADGDRWLTIGGDETRQTKGKRDTFVTGAEQRVNEDDMSRFVDGDEVRVNQAKLSQFVTGDELRQNLSKLTAIVAGAVARFNGTGETVYTLGDEKKVNVGNFTNWTVGQRTEVVVGTFQQIVLGQFSASVFGNYERSALGNIMDKAQGGIVHTSGTPTATIPFPPTPPIPTVAPIAPIAPICPGEPACPVVPADEDCPPIPT